MLLTASLSAWAGYANGVHHGTPFDLKRIGWEDGLFEIKYSKEAWEKKWGIAKEKGFWSNLDDMLGRGLYGSQQNYNAIKLHSGNDNPYMMTKQDIETACEIELFVVTSFIPVGELLQLGRVGIFAAKGWARIGTKLEYVFGKATGSLHNIERSTGMLKQLQSVGIFDNAVGRSLLKRHLKAVYNGVEGILQSNGRYLRESLLMGPNGGLKVESIWEGSRLITIKLLGGK